MDGVQIRDAFLRDVNALSALLVEVHDLHVAALPDIFAPIETDAQTDAFLRNQLAHPDGHALVAEDDGNLVGYCWIRIHAAPSLHHFVPRYYAEIDTLVVAATHRQRGIGRALVERAHAWAAAQGVDEVRIVVYEFNQEALHFYEGLGYETGRRTLWSRLAQDPTQRDGAYHRFTDEPWSAR
jgi:ribosomal protein S18 acetylase RimI-like enzyme